MILDKAKEIIFGIFFFIGGTIVIILLFWASGSIQKVPPDNLMVLADHKYKTYISPECLNQNFDYNTDEFEPVTLATATDDLEYTYDSECTYESIFPSRNAIWDFVGTKIGFLKPIGRKWNEDGTWKIEVFK